AFEPFDDRLKLFQGSFVFSRELDKHSGVLDVAFELVGFLNRGFETAAPAKHFLSAFLVIPEIGLRRLFFYSGEFGALGFRVKETSATPRRARPGLRIFVSVLRS